MLEYIYDFLSILFDKLKEKEKIRSIILFGSFARGNPRKDSDIDIFIDIEEKNKEEISSLVKESINEFEIKAEKTWKLRGITNQIIPIVDSLESEQWKELKQEIQSYGNILYGNYIEKDKGSRHKILITYDMAGLKQKNKMHIIRKLFGYKIKKGKKLYEQRGLLKNINAEKLSNAIIVNIENYKTITDLLRKNKVPLKISEVWFE